MKKILFCVILVLIIPAISFSQPEPSDPEKNPSKGDSNLLIGEVVVHDKALANIEKATTSTFITDKDIEARGEKVLHETLKMVPGLNIYQHTKGSWRLNMRGHDLNRVAILIDGMPLQDIFEANLDLSQISVLNVSRIVVNRGISSVLYGNNSVAGSINILTKRPEKMTTSISAEYGLYNNSTFNVSHGAPIGDFHYWVTATLQHSDGYQISSKLTRSQRERWWYRLMNPGAYGYDRSDFTIIADDQYITDSGIWDHNNYTKVTTAMRMGYNITDLLEVGLNLRYFFKTQKSSTFASNYMSSFDSSTGTWSDPADGGPAWRNTYTSEGMRAGFQSRNFVWPEYHNYTVSPYLIYNGNNFRIRANIYYTSQNDTLESYTTQHHLYAFFPPADVFDTAVPVFQERVRSQWTNRTLGFNIMPSIKLASWNRLNFAFLFRHDEHIQREQILSPAKAPQVFAIHGIDYHDTFFMSSQFYTFAVEDEIKPFDNLEISIGFSYDSIILRDYKDISDTYHVLIDQYRAGHDSTLFGTRDGFSSTLGLVYSPVEDLLTLRAAGSIRTKLPTLESYKGLQIGSGAFIKPETSYNTNVGFIVIPFSNDILNIGIDYFYSYFRDKIERTFNPYANSSIYWNVTNSVTHGIECNISSEMKDLFSIVDMHFNFNYTLLLIKNEDNSTNSMFNNGDRPEQTPTHQFIFDLRFAFTSKTSLTLSGVYQLNQITYVTAGTPGVNYYTTAAFRQVRVHDPIKINIRLSQKVFDYFDAWVMCKNVLDDYSADPFNPGPGRMWFAGVKSTF